MRVLLKIKYHNRTVGTKPAVITPIKGQAVVLTVNIDEIVDHGIAAAVETIINRIAPDTPAVDAAETDCAQRHRETQRSAVKKALAKLKRQRALDAKRADS